jgi:esterase/lipase
VKRGHLLVLLAAIAAVAGLAMVSAPPILVGAEDAPEIPRDIDAWLTRSEASVGAGNIIPGTEKRIQWFGGHRNSKTRYAVVYLHGFSATRQELAPVDTQVAKALQANLFETRLRGHGLQHHALSDVHSEDWLEDAAEALAVGIAIGDHIVLMGTSTGATLALAMHDHPLFAKVSTLVLVSPNFGPLDHNAEFLTWPGGPQLAYLVAGKTRSWTPANPRQARFWSTTYPMDAVIEMMRLVRYVRDGLPLRMDQSMLVFYSPFDRVVDTDLTRQAIAQIDSPQKRLVAIEQTGDPSNHVLAGDIMSPENNDLLVDTIVRFVLESMGVGKTATEPTN